jgi:ABC-type lipoprotein release transport system permease subunit
VSLLILVGAAWILLGIAAWLLGNALRTLLQALRLGLIDSLVGALLGLAQSLLLCSAILFLLEATGTFLVPAPEPIRSLALASAASQSAGLLHGIVYPFIWTLIGSSLPSELQQILRP